MDPFFCGRRLSTEIPQKVQGISFMWATTPNKPTTRFDPELTSKDLHLDHKDATMRPQQ